MSDCSRKTAWLLTAVSMLVIAGSCSGVVDGHPTPPMGTREPTISPSPIPLPQPCDSDELILPESVVAASRDLTSGEHANILGERWAKQNGWLSLRLALTQTVFEYTAPILVQLTITNKTDHPVVFLRPKLLAFGCFPPIELCVSLLPVAGKSPWPVALIDLYPWPPDRSAFSMLPAGESCTVQLHLTPDQIPELWLGKEPFPPGDYRMSVALMGWRAGPTVDHSGFPDVLDVGAWVGETEPSNVVTLTILPPER